MKKTPKELKQDLYYDLLYKYSELKFERDFLKSENKKKNLQILAYKNTIEYPEKAFQFYNNGLRDSIAVMRMCLSKFNIVDYDKACEIIKSKKL